MANTFIQVDRDTPYLFPPCVQKYPPEDHLARFVVDIVDQLDLRPLSAAYAGRGSKAFHPSQLVALLFYGYATGVFSSRKLEAATYDSVAFRYLCANTHPDHDTIARFRARFLTQLEALFVEILVVAQVMRLVKLGTISLDGTKIKANASKHNRPLTERFQDDPAPPNNPTPVQAMKHHLQTTAGKSRYAKRKATVETVFGIIKHVQGFRQFLLRGFAAVKGEWSLVCIGWNLKRMHVLRRQHETMAVPALST